MKELKEVFDRLNIEFDEERESKYKGYMDDVLELNKSINLTAITDRDKFIEGHYVDSLACAFLQEFDKARRVVDIGTGGGFPGVPLAIAYPDKEFVLVDSLNKRIKIINSLCEKYEITNVKAIHGRAEELARKSDLRDSFDMCVSRAVANMSTLVELCLPFVKTGGFFVAYKGPESDEEINNSAKAIKTLGGTMDRIAAAEIGPRGTQHRLVIVSKERETPKKYPRKPGTPGKTPIR
ncbi:MAG: 16S rRNA (guanine(527)-N(7))-methyltransferase RsmG [Firmicutes bacterium]|nr:16S rRNA (guanine(527)-N(7))-methyltransferase RsmG [Bacillota bacterium]